MIGDSQKGELNFADVIDFLNRYKKHFAIISLAAGLLSVVFTMPYFMAPKYKATIIVYPTKTSSIAKSYVGLLSDQFDNLAFGLETDAEQLLQIIESDEITDKICSKYDLIDRYGIDRNGRYPNHKLSNSYHSNVKFTRTEYMSVEISVMDEDPKIATAIAADIAKMADSLKSTLQQGISKAAYEIIKTQYQQKVDKINKGNDTLAKIGALGVINTDRQPGIITETYLKAKASGNMALAKEMEKLLDNFAKYSPAARSFTEEVRIESGHLSDLYQKMQQVEMDAFHRIPHQYVISKAMASDKPAYPIRSLFVLFAMGFAFVSSLIYFAIKENYRRGKTEVTLGE
ncbi:MAG: Wzz/FepE/Etk N-terminal domain-containing protein [Bacteroidetes bacterium]|nr:Wzz/FepE/Etk N-terminal domain-containing protein [Bacteroidota bacterium]